MVNEKKQIKARMSTAEKLVEAGNKKAAAAVNQDNKLFSECLNVVANTKEGQYVLNRLLETCGQFRSSVVSNTDGVTDEGSVQYREGRRSVWIYDIYKYVSVANLKKIMFFNRRKLCLQKKKIQDQD